jgi:hypothetical protein
MTAQQIVDENFKGLDDLIEDPDLRQFYRDLIVECINGYAQQDAQQRYEKAMEFLDLDIAELENIDGLQLMTTTFGNMKTALLMAAGGKE